MTLPILSGLVVRDISSHSNFTALKDPNFFISTLIENGVTLETEIDLANKMSESQAVRLTATALLEVATKLVIEVHGEINGIAGIIQAVSPSCGDSVVQPVFTRVGSVGWNGIRILETIKTGDFREQCVQFGALVTSSFFKKTLQEISLDCKLQKKCENLLDLSFLKKIHEKNTEDAYIYPNEFRKRQAESRQPTKKSISRYLTEDAARLTKIRNLTVSQLKYHLQNPINRPFCDDNRFPLKQAKSVAELAETNHFYLEDIKIESDYGFCAWTLIEDSSFIQEARINNLPVVAGPSGATYVLMLAARFLACGAQDILGILPTSDSTYGAADNLSYLELIRFMLYSYLVADRHHSFVEVNDVAAEHGLARQQNNEIYTCPFSSNITGEIFQIGNSDMNQFAEKILIENKQYNK